MTTLYFPQLATGAMAQFPVKKHVEQRTVVNRSISEQLIRLADPEGETIRWDLPYEGLTDAEMAAFETLFASCEGRLRPFVFLDPLGNLLRWTEDLTKSVWQGGLLIANGIEDPRGGTRACRLTNGAQGGQSIRQSVDAPGWYTYTFSVSARSSSATSVRLLLTNPAGEVAVSRPIGPAWQRVSVTGRIEGHEEEIRCGIETPGGTAVDIYGPQLEPQGDVSGYRRNMQRGGVYLARFDQDELERTSYGPDEHATRLRVVTVKEVTR